MRKQDNTEKGNIGLDAKKLEQAEHAAAAGLRDADAVTLAAADTFPASDPPAWTYLSVGCAEKGKN